MSSQQESVDPWSDSLPRPAVPDETPLLPSPLQETHLDTQETPHETDDSVQDHANVTEEAREQAEIDEEEAQRIYVADLKFYLQQVFLIIRPVVVCMILSIIWVKIVNTGADNGGFAPASYNYLTGNTSSENQSFVDSLVNAAIILSQIILATIVILLLFKYNCMKVLVGIFVLIVVALLGLFGYYLIAAMCYKLNMAMDWVTMAIILWNFAMVGVVCVFWKCPLWLQQVYLVIMSSLMAFSFTGLPEFTTWILLALLACWDLFAVLAPIGPLKLLIESSRDNNREIPALLYTVAVWMMAWEEPPTRPPQPVIVQMPSGPGPAALDSPGFEPPNLDGTGVKMTSMKEPDQVSRVSQENREPHHNIMLPDSMEDQTNDEDPNETASQAEEDDEEEAERSGLKLGLGDFVFYSVMVSRAALSDWVTTITVSLSAITGLVATIFLLVIFRKALPALPISIALGLIFYFSTSKVMVPWIIQGLTPSTKAYPQFWNSPVVGMPGWADENGNSNWLQSGTLAGGQVFV